MGWCLNLPSNIEQRQMMEEVQPKARTLKVVALPGTKKYIDIY